MQSQLEQLEKEYGIEWQNYSIEGLFGKSSRGRRLKSADRVYGNLPFVTAGEGNMGISAWIGNDVHVYSDNTVTIDMFGSAKYRNYQYGADDHVAIVHAENWPKLAVIYLTAAIHKSSHAGQFDYSRNFYASDADELIITLPTVIKNGQSEIAFDYMEKFIATLNAERIATLNAYLTTTGLNDYNLTHEEQVALESFGSVALYGFNVGDLFDIRPTKNYGLSNKDLLTSNGNVPVVSNTSINNGITAYVDLRPTEKGNMITFSDTTTDEAIFYQPYDFVGYSHIQGMHKKFENEIGKNHYLYIVTAFKTAVRGKYNYGSKFNRDNAAREKIKLPVNPDGTPDYNYMSHVISAMQKVVIKNVVDDLDIRIKHTAKVLC
jgi:hypothetical protein